MELLNYKKFIGVIIFGYFAIKIYYNFLFEDIYIKNSNEELVDLSITIVLSSIVFILTNFDKVMINPIVYYIGFLIGTQVVVIKNLFNNSINNSKIVDFLFYFIVIAYTVIFIYFYVIQNLGESTISPLLIITCVISLLIGIILSSRKQIDNDSLLSKDKNFVISKLNPNIGFFSFLASILMIHSSKENLIISFIQSILIGSFVSYFSYYKPEFIMNKDNSFMLNNLSLIDLSKFLYNEQSNTETIDNKFHKTLNEIYHLISSNFKEIKSSLDSSMLKAVKIESYDQDIKTNKLISGLSYLTILVTITILYVYYGGDKLVNSK